MPDIRPVPRPPSNRLHSAERPRYIAPALSGVLLDTRPAKVAAMATLASRHGLHIPFSGDTQAQGVRDLLRNFFAKPKDLEYAWSEYNKYFFVDGPNHTTPFDGAKRFLEALKQHGWRSLLITTLPLTFARGALKHNGMRVDKLHCVRGSSGKAPALLEFGAEVVVTSEVKEVSIAKAIGLRAIGIHGLSDKQMRLAGAEVILDSVEDLPDYLPRL